MHGEGSDHLPAGCSQSVLFGEEGGDLSTSREILWITLKKFSVVPLQLLDLESDAQLKQ